MNESIKKIGVVSVLLVFLISGITPISADSIQSTITNVTLFRIGPEGVVTPITVKLKLDKNLNPDEVEARLVDKCAELAENDDEIHQYLDDSGTNTSLISFVKSRGRGIHYDFKVRTIVKRHFKKFPNLPPFYRILKIHVIYAKYPRDQRAHSIIKDYDTGNVTSYDGIHDVTAVGFLGYTTWLGLIAKRGFFLRCGFAGYAVVSATSF